jgi:predicted CXXCH cytochrome family protein
MRTTRVLLTVLLVVLAPALAGALDAPHDKSYLPANCQQCHQLHNALGSSLTTQLTITDACLSCHSTYGGAGHRLGFPWASADQAVAGVSGAQHRWSADAVNPAVGTVLPSDPEMAKRVIAGKLECSVCHNQHAANKTFVSTAAMHTSFAVGTAYPETNAGGGTATLTIQSANPATAVPRGYRLRVVSAGNVAVSHDAGLSWFKPTTNTGAAWVADTAVPVGGPYSTAVDLALDDPAIAVRLTAGATVNDYWSFYVSFPMLRSPNLSGTLCLSCHQDRAQSHLEVESGGDGVKVFSHPVGEGLNANGRNYDVTTAPLDADGGVQAVNGDANATNDLTLSAGGVVGCTSCHAPHNADSNSLTVDPR